MLDEKGKSMQGLDEMKQESTNWQPIPADDAGKPLRRPTGESSFTLSFGYGQKKSSTADSSSIVASQTGDKLLHQSQRK